MIQGLICHVPVSSLPSNLGCSPVQLSMGGCLSPWPALPQTETSVGTHFMPTG